MASFNKVQLMGNLTRDPQVKFLPSQMQVAEFGLACNRRFKTAQGEDREEVTFVDVSAFGKTAELISKYFTKGKPIFIEGRLKYDAWEDKQGGGKRSKLSVVVDNVIFLPRGGDAGGGGGGGYSSGAPEAEQSYDEAPAPPAARPAASRPAPPRPAPARAPAARPPAEQPFGEEQQFKDDDIPF